MTYNYNNSLLGDYLTPSGEHLIVENPIIIQSGSINNTVIGNVIPSSGYFSNLIVNGTGVSLTGHTHVVNDITDFDTSVSGLLSVTNVSQGSGILVSENNKDFTISADNNYIEDLIQDNFNTNVIAGSGIVLTYDEPNLIISASGSALLDSSSENIPNTLVLRDSSGNFSSNEPTFNVVQLNVASGVIEQDIDLNPAEIAWNSDQGTLDYGLIGNGTNLIHHIGQEIFYRAYNGSGQKLYAGMAVYAIGVNANGKRISVGPYVADGTTREIRFVGIVSADMEIGENGYVTHFGFVRKLDTRSTTSTNYSNADENWQIGDILYVDPTTPGKLTKFEPKHSISVAIVTNVNQNNGLIFVRPTSYGHLDDNHDVSVSGATNGQFLQYNSSTDYWVPSSSGNFTSLQVNGTGVSVNGHSHTSSNITDFNSSVSGLLPVKNIIAGDNVEVTSSSGIFTVSSISVSGSVPTINNVGDNRILTSTGSSTGINAESNASFDGLALTIGGLDLGQNNRPTINIKSENATGSALLQLNSTNNFSLTNQINFIKNRGTIDNPLSLPANSGVLGVFRYATVNFSGVYPSDLEGNQSASVARIRVDLDRDPVDGENGVPTRIIFNTTKGDSLPTNDNSLVLDSSGTLTNSGDGYFIGSLTVDNGLSSPTPILSLGSVSGNVSISYGVNKQIQTLTLNGTATNLIKGSDWPTAFSADVLLEITVSSTTTLSFSIVDDWYNPVPSFVTGKYLVLLRSMGSIIQGHYIGNKTN